jgi:acyl CoA:acetate/3-ketoacid CoA transferase beta subunit
MPSTLDELVTRADVCVVAIAECFRGDGEILGNPIGTIPMIGGRLARATFEPDLLMTDGEAFLVADDRAFFGPNDARIIEHHNPYRAMFDIVWRGPRHIMMGATQIDRFGNQNIAFLGSHTSPTVQLIGFRGAPGNTINNKTSYWIANHSTRVFVPEVDVVSGVGYQRAAALHRESARSHEIVRVVTNLCVCDFDTPDHHLRLRSVHPGVSVADVVAATGFELVVPADVPDTRIPTDEEVRWIREVIDPLGLGEKEVPSP